MRRKQLSVRSHTGDISGLPDHVRGLLAYMSDPDERANEDLAIKYFRQLYPDTFTRQKDAKKADGYVPGSFVLELKGKTSDWLSGFFQALAYQKRDLDFSQIVVVARDFLAIWRVDDLPVGLRASVLTEPGAPHEIGSRLAKRNSSKRAEVIELAVWTGFELASSLFLSSPKDVLSRINAFEDSLRAGHRIRSRVTVANFVSTLREMREFFEPDQPVKTVRAFYSMVYAWTDNSTVILSEKTRDQVTLGGEVITNLIPNKRIQFKQFVEGRRIHLEDDQSIDDFFARYDQALDSVDRNFRIKHGIFFTDLFLSKFAMWSVKRHLPDLGKNYLVIDPACGSGNLVTNWRSPLEIRHKVVSEIEPELLFAVDRRMQGDAWHDGKFTVVPRISENAGLNFLDRDAHEYLERISQYLKRKNLTTDKPIAFLCNPPYRSDEDQTAEGITYEINPRIVDRIGRDAASERYCCFLAQMKMICEVAQEKGLPGDSMLLLFTKSAWLTRRPVFARIRNQVLSSFENVGGMLVDGREFFQVKGSWPVAFTMWRYKGDNTGLNADRSIPLRDMTWMKRNQLVAIPWGIEETVESECEKLLKDPRAALVYLGEPRVNIQSWTGEKMLDFKRSRRKEERDKKIAGGLPIGVPQQSNKKAYGEYTGAFIGFMDDLTPCRVKRGIPDRPWFRLNRQFSDIKKNRCFSGPPDNRGFCAEDLPSAMKLFFWYALARTFLQHPYPMWIDSDELWEPVIPSTVEKRVYQLAFSIGYAENECVSISFPADNPMKGAPQLSVRNPLTPLNDASFWSTTLKPYCDSSKSSSVHELISSVDDLFAVWKRLFRNRREVTIFKRPYMIGSGALTIGAGIQQIRDYSRDNEVRDLRERLEALQERLALAKTELFELASSSSGFDYFGARKKQPSAASMQSQQITTLRPRKQA